MDFSGDRGARRILSPQSLGASFRGHKKYRIHRYTDEVEAVVALRVPVVGKFEVLLHLQADHHAVGRDIEFADKRGTRERG